MGFGMAAVDRAEPFADNWAYLKVELNWLEKVLLTAATRQKKENREIDRLSKTKADRASSAWWQGLIEVEGRAGHDSPPPTGGMPYAQQLARRLEATASGKLALPSLCARLELGSFEKSVILMGLAAEVHRRYGQLYEYLCGPDRLPTVDLALRLLCRDDRAWRQGRACLDADSKLRRYGLIAFRGEAGPLRERSLFLSEDLVSFLLSEVPDGEWLDRLVGQESRFLSKSVFALGQYVEEGVAPQLVLPESVRVQAEGIAARLRSGMTATHDWQGVLEQGLILLLTGAKGTGKRSLVCGMAQAGGVTLMEVDLRDGGSAEAIVAEIERLRPEGLLVRSSGPWLGGMEADLWGRLVRSRREARLTVFCSERAVAMGSGVRGCFDARIRLERPGVEARRLIWPGCFAPQVELDGAIDWDALARYELTGGEIAAVVREVVVRFGGGAIGQEEIESVLGAYGRRLTRPKKGS
jgi:hypothetical protein